MEDNNKNKYKAMSEISLSLGIISIISCLFWYITMPAGILAIVLGAKAVKHTGKKAGVITGIVGLSVFAFIYISLIMVLLLAGI